MFKRNLYGCVFLLVNVYNFHFKKAISLRIFKLFSFKENHLNFKLMFLPKPALNAVEMGD